MREPPSVGEFGREAKRLLGGAEGLGRPVVGLEGQCETIVNIPSAGTLGDGGAEIVDRWREMPQREMSAAAKVVGLAIFWCELNDLVESRQGLIRLVSRNWMAAIFRLTSAIFGSSSRARKYSAQRLGRFSLGFEQPAQREVGPSADAGRSRWPPQCA